MEKQMQLQLKNIHIACDSQECAALLVCCSMVLCFIHTLHNKCILALNYMQEKANKMGVFRAKILYHYFLH